MESLHHKKPYDALVIIRGGGAKLDLNMLNLEKVAEKICLLNLPVMSGIGHERDNTIIDEVANTRFDTPSKVIAHIKNQIVFKAKQAQSDWHAIEKSSQIKVEQLHNSINKLQHQIEQNSRSLTFLWQKKLEPINHEIQNKSAHKLNVISHEISSLLQHIQNAVANKLERSELETTQLIKQISESSLRAIDLQKKQLIQNISFILSSGPKVQLNRGFSLVKNHEGRPITSAMDAIKTKHIAVEFADGSVEATVVSKSPTKPNSNL